LVVEEPNWREGGTKENGRGAKGESYEGLKKDATEKNCSLRGEGKEWRECK